MTVPDFQSMMRPVLELHADGLPHTSADVRDNVAQVLGVTEEDRQVPLPPHELRRSAAWSTFGPHPIGVERFATVSSSLQR